MMPGWCSRWIFYACRAFAWAAGAIGTFVAATLRTSDGGWESSGSLLLVPMTFRNAYWLGPLCGAIAGVSVVAMKLIGPPWVDRALRVQLDAVHAFIFPPAQFRVRCDQTVALFKTVRPLHARVLWWRPSRAKLMPVGRSHAELNRGLEPFKVPMDRTHAHGVAGQSLRGSEPMVVGGLPDLHREENWEAIERYAGATCCGVPDVKARLPRSRWICAVQIQSRGEPWGVLSFSTRRPEGTEHGTPDNLEIAKAALGPLLPFL